MPWFARNTSTFLAGLVLGLLIGGLLGWYIAPQGAPPALRITCSGSTTLFPLSQKWAEEYRQLYPMVQIQVAAGGSGLGQSQCGLGIVDIGASSSYPDTETLTRYPGLRVIPVAADALAIIVNPSVNGSRIRFTRNQLISIFNGSITTWEEFAEKWNVTVQAHGNIRVYVRSEASGTTATLGLWLERGEGWTRGHKETISWSEGVIAVEGNPGVRSGVQSDPNGIGYVSLAFIEGVTAAAIYNEGNGEWVNPSFDAAKAAIPENYSDASIPVMDSSEPGGYPIARLLFYLVNVDFIRQAPLDFIKWCVSSTGGQNPQWVREEVGYLEISGTGAQALAQSILGSITPRPGRAPILSILAPVQSIGGGTRDEGRKHHELK